MIAILAVAAFAAVQHPSTASFTFTDTHVSLNGGATSDATVALGATVRFAYPEGAAKHNVNIERHGPDCTQLAGAGTGNRSRILPNPPEGPGWVVECRFDTPGVYHFASDEHGTLNGVVRVANADGSVPTENQPPAPAPQETYVPGQAVSGGGTTTGGSGGPGTAQGKRAPKWTVAASQRGTAVRAALTGGSERTRVVVEAYAKRADLRAKGKAKLVRVGRVSRTVAAGARVTVSVPLNAKAKAALRRLGRMKLTLRVTVAGKTTSKTVTLRKPRSVA